jgi:ATP-dependent helicase/nuclease subunit A
MKPELSKITYDKKAALYVGASYPEPSLAQGVDPNLAEYLFIDVDTVTEDTSDESAEEANEAKEWEARAVAKRIKQLMAQQEVVDKKSGDFRPIRYQDIVILTRSVKGWADLYRRVLMEEGIPAHVGSQEGYFETYEISVLLDYLKILDNFQQELPLVAVLTSSFVGLDEETLAKIRTAYPNRPFYDAILQSVKEEEAGVLVEEIQTTLQRFLTQYQSFRKRVPYLAIHELLWQILEETGYASCISAMQGGEQRMANVEMLMEKAIAFEGTSYKGLFQFVRYMERLQKYDVDYGEAELVDEQSDTVRILTIHKSKGLEFPVVFVAGMSKTFNTQDVRSKIVMHSDWGIGLEAIDLERRTKVDTVWKKFIQEDLKLENLSEELRVLYVALTRAKEKLILVGQLKDAQQKLENWKESLSYCDLEHHGLPQHYLLKAKSYQDWMLPIIGGWSDCIPMQIRIVLRDELRRSEQVEAVAESLAKEVLLNWNPDQVFDEELRAQLVEQAGYTYPYEQDGVQKAKVTVSELKRAMQEVDVDAQEMYAEEQAQTVPEFRKEEKKVRGISRGNAYHHLLQHLDFAALTDETSLKQQIDQLLAAGKLTEEMKGQIWTKDVWKFLESSVGRRLRAAKHIWKEQPFVLQMPATQVYPQADASETILMQGIMDAYFEEEDGIVLVDYKTDRVKEAEELKQRYGVQLQYYTQALEQLTKRKVKEKIIYSFALGKEIPV